MNVPLLFSTLDFLMLNFSELWFSLNIDPYSYELFLNEQLSNWTSKLG